MKESCEQITNISETKTRNSYLGKHVSTDADVRGCSDAVPHSVQIG